VEGALVFDCFIFDVDGTLLDTREANEVSLSRLIFEKKGHRPTKEELAADFGRTGQATLARYGIEDIPEGLLIWGSYISDYGAAAAPFEGIRETLAALKAQGRYLGIVTSRQHSELDSDLAHFGLDHLFDKVICAEDTTRHKPEPEPLFEFFKSSPVPQEGSLYIGDTNFDALCASSSGTGFGLALWGALPGVAAGMPVLHRLRHPRELLELC